jgi:hypothetical protein
LNILSERDEKNEKHIAHEINLFKVHKIDMTLKFFRKIAIEFNGIRKILISMMLPRFVEAGAPH